MNGGDRLGSGFIGVVVEPGPTISTEAKAARVGEAALRANQHQARSTYATKPGIRRAAKSTIGAQHRGSFFNKGRLTPFEAPGGSFS